MALACTVRKNGVNGRIRTSWCWFSFSRPPVFTLPGILPFFRSLVLVKRVQWGPVFRVPCFPGALLSGCPRIRRAKLPVQGIEPKELNPGSCSDECLRQVIAAWNCHRMLLLGVAAGCCCREFLCEITLRDAVHGEKNGRSRIRTCEG